MSRALPFALPRNHTMPELNAKNVHTVPAGEHYDPLTPCLYLLVRPGKNRLRRSWMLRTTINGKRKNFGLGPLYLVGLAEARQKAKEALRLVAEGKDPRSARAPQGLTFKAAIDLYLEEVAKPYKNPKSEEIRTRALETVCQPLHSRPVETITPRDIRSALKPFAPEMQRKALTTIKAVFALAMVEMETRGAPLLRNPAAPDLMQVVGYQRRSPATDKPHPALAFEQMPAFMEDLAKVETPAARLLKFIILTASRSGAARLTRFDQIDFDKRLWRVPAEQLKDSEHRSADFVVPLSDAALAVVETMKARATSPFVFAGADGEPLKGDLIITLIRALRRRGGWCDPHSGRPITIHGFRASFRTFVESTRRRDRDIAEICLGHRIDDDEVKARYIRTHLIDERRLLLDDWARHCAGHCAEIRPFRRRAR